MYKSVIFIDFENIQKIDTSKIDLKTKVIVIVGLNQDKKAFEFTKELFLNITSIELIKVNGKGENALDFFIAFYLGKYFESIKESEIIIYSNDAGYDPLIKHLDEYGISIKRNGLNKEKTKKASGSNSKGLKVKNEKQNNEINIIIEYLQKQTKSQKGKRPIKRVTLENYLHTHFSRKISEEKIKLAIDFMINNNYIDIDKNNKIIYKI